MWPREDELIGLIKSKAHVWNGQGVDKLFNSTVGA